MPLCVACVVSIVLVGCAGIEPTSRSVSPAERREYAEAISSLPADTASAERRLQTFLRNWPDSRLSAEALVRLAKIEREQGNTNAALQHFYDVLRQFPRSDAADSARLGAAALEYDRANRAAAVRMLRITKLDRLTPDERHEAYRLLADSARSALERIEWLSALRAGETEAAALAQIDTEIDTLIAVLDDRELAHLASTLDRAVPAGRALLLIAERALERGDLEVARTHVALSSDLPFAPNYAPQLTRVADRLRALEMGGGEAGSLPSFETAQSRGMPDTRAASGEIGVILPLSGKFASYGEESLRGILLAAGVFDAVKTPNERPQIRLLIRDTAGQAERAAAAVRELAQRESVPVILGPLLSKECEAAAAAAEAEGVPLVALTSREEVARDRSQVFRVRTMPKDEVQTLAEHAIRDLGVTRFGILYPRDAYGRGLSDLFWNAVESRGGSIVALASYDRDSTDFSEGIRRLVGWELLSAGENARIKDREALISRARRLLPDEASLVRDEARSLVGPRGQWLPPIVDFDALFIPETYENIVLIAPQLAYNEANGAVLLGSEAWNHADLVEIGRHHVEGARFTANFYAQSPIAYVREFADRYAATFGTPAEDFAAQAYDAMNLVLIPMARENQSRSSLREAVLSTSGFPGASGIMSIGVDGNARKRPFLLGVERGRIVQVD